VKRRAYPLTALLILAALAGFVRFEEGRAGERLQPDKWAVIIGVSDYLNLGEEGRLPGAGADARALRDVLVARWGFPQDQTLLLLDGEATKEGIRSALTEWLPDRAGPDDEVVVYFAGHGSQIWVDDGETPDGLRQTIAPADVLLDAPDYDILDRELREWLEALATENVTVLLDSCHSGQLTTRDATPFSRARTLSRNMDEFPRPPSATPRSLPSPEEARGMELGRGGMVELAATQPHQVAVEMLFPSDGGGEPFHGGAFTTFLVQQLWKAPPGATYQEVFESVREALKRHRFEQDPHLSEETDRRGAPLFQTGAAAGGAARLPVVQVSDGNVELGAGGALGITTGSIFELDSGGRILVESVSRDRSWGRVLEGEGIEGSEARLAAYRFPRTELAVGVGGVGTLVRDAARAALDDVPGVRLVEDEATFAHLFLRRRGDEVWIVGMDGAVRHTFEMDEVGGEEFVQALRREAAAKRLGEMDNLGQEFSLEVRLEGGATSFGLGELVTFRASSDRAGYLTLVDLGTDGTVTVLLPNPFDPDNRVEAGREIVFPSPGMGSDIVALPPTGRGMVRAFLTERPLDIPVGDEFASGDVLFADRIAEALREAAGRTPGSEEAVRLDTWGTASVSYEIHQ
jgi:hypothetical protein